MTQLGELAYQITLLLDVPNLRKGVIDQQTYSLMLELVYCLMLTVATLAGNDLQST